MPCSVPKRGEARRIAAAAVHVMHADDVARLLTDQLHVLDVRADVFGDDVATAERIDEAAERAQQRLALVGLRIADDHGLARRRG